MTRPTRRLVGVLLAGALAAATSACGTTDALVGLHPAPAESADTVPLDRDGATAIAARLLAGQKAAAATKGDKGHDARAQVLRGDALTFADQVAARGAASDAGDELTREVDPQVLAQSQGKEWPRAILATTLDETSSTQYLHVMVSRDPAEPFKIEASVPMLGGAQLPSVGDEQTGAPFLDPNDSSGLVMSTREAFQAYAKALATPAPSKKKAPKNVAVDDSFAAALKESAKEQVKALGKLGDYTQRHTLQKKNTVAFRLADGSVVGFGLLKRVDVFEPSAKAKELTVPAPYAKLVGTKTVTDSMTLTSLEPVVVLVPVEGDVSAIGATELLVSGKGS